MQLFNKFLLYIIIAIFFGCKSENIEIVNEKYIDSLLIIKGLSANQKALAIDSNFWKTRYEQDKNSYTNGQQYAAILQAKFKQYGDINDLKMAESIIQKINKIQNGVESGLNRTLAHLTSQQHRFQEANNYANLALKIGDNKYETTLLLFDAAFELGKIEQARIFLSKIKKQYEYAYYFRLAKMQHYDGDLEQAMESMQKAADLSQGNKSLAQAALSNMADLALHSGDFEKASLNYQKSLAIDQADYHSIKGLGIIAQLYDKNYNLANKIFNFVATKTQSPDIYFNLAQLAQSQNNKVAELKNAELFEQKASLSIYGNMYNKYLIELYDGPLKNHKKMLHIAEKELENRGTAQTNSWYAWALYQNNQKAKALAIYKSKVASKPLEGLELYFMGKMMEAEKKDFNANAYFEAAFKNRFELAPSKKTELEAIYNS
jgi:hypothetical protein